MKHFLLIAIASICSAANGQTFVVQGKAAVSPKPVVASTELEAMHSQIKELQSVIASLQTPKLTANVKTCSCSSKCSCGCNAGLPCKCGQPTQPALKTQAIVSSQRFLISELWCHLCQGVNGAKARFIASGGDPNNILTMAEAKRRHGISHNPPFEYVAEDRQATEVRTPVGQYTDDQMRNGYLGWPQQQPAVSVVGPPVRFIQWPGWGQIDLETYNRNCNCSMCNSIRAQQQEYWRQLKSFQQSQTQVETVTPDQEGTPHALVEITLDSMGLRSGDILGDIGCGDGRILIAAGRRGIRGIGVEIDPIRASVARRAVANAGLSHLITIETGDALEFDMSRVTVATTYLYPPLLAKLSPKLASLRVVASPYHEIPGLGMVQKGEIWIKKS